MVNWIDGDTCELLIDRAFSDVSRRMLRVAGIDAPDYSKSVPGSHIRKANATLYAHTLAPVGSVVQLESIKGKEHEKYGRYMAKITLPDGRDFATEMIKAGHAKPYGGGAR